MNKQWIPDYNKLYDSDDDNNRIMTRFEYGLYQIKLIAMQRRRKLRTKSDYNTLRNAIEKQLMDL